MTINVLIVDDNIIFCNKIADTLKSIDSDYAFKEVYSGEECISILEYYQPDVILLDIIFPGMDGLQTGMKIRENKKTRNLPIIFVTMRGDEMSRKVGKIVGNAFFEKALDFTTLDDTIKSIVGKKEE